MSTRKFTVFLDEPTTTRRPLSRSLSTPVILTSNRSENIVGSSRSVLGVVPEKENVHPVTGNTTTSTQTGKKRKASESGSVLATKAFAPVAVEAKPKRAEAKRKLSSSKAKASKEPAKRSTESKKVLGAVKVNAAPVKRAPSVPPSRSSPVTLDSVPEEVEEKLAVNETTKSETKAEMISQARINERCYELTVSPLADVTDAYLQSFESKDQDSKADDKILPEYRIVKEDSCFATQIRDYFSPEGSRTDSLPSLTSSTSFTSSLFGSFDTICSQSSSVPTAVDEENGLPTTPTKKLKRTASAPNTPKEAQEARASIAPLKLTTPERKQLYAAFTFMTPTTSPVKST